MKICPQCGIEFVPTHHLQKFCSYGCYYQFNLDKKNANCQPVKKLAPTLFIEPIIPGRCLACRKSFRPQFSGAKFCSDQCRIDFFGL